jgi:prepilin-type N-terminal cleavage/methylation domain-containing protein
MKKRGFSLIELMIAIFLLCLVAGPLITLFTKTVQITSEALRERKLAQFMKATIDTICDRYVWQWEEGERVLELSEEVKDFVKKATVYIREEDEDLRSVRLEVEYKTIVGTERRESIVTWSSFVPLEKKLGGG